MNLFSRKKTNPDFDFKKVNESKSVLESTINNFLDSKSESKTNSNDNTKKTFDDKKNILENQLKKINNKRGNNLLNTLNTINSRYNSIIFKYDDIWNINKLNEYINNSCDNLYTYITKFNCYALKTDYKIDNKLKGEWNIKKLLNHKQGETLFNELGFIRRSMFINGNGFWNLKKLKDNRLIKFAVYINNTMIGFVDTKKQVDKCMEDILDKYMPEYILDYPNSKVMVNKLENGFNILSNYNFSIFNYDKILCSVRYKKINRI